MEKVDMVNGRANRLQGEAHFTYEGRAFKLTINNRSLLEAEEVLGESMLDFGNEILLALQAGRNPRMKHICAIVFGGLVINHADITEDEVIDMVMSGDENVRQGIFNAMRGVQAPAADSGPVGNDSQRAKSAGTGKPSSKGGAKPASTPRRSGSKPRSR